MTIRDYEILRIRLDDILFNSYDKKVMFKRLSHMMSDLLKLFKGDKHASDLHLEIIDRLVHAWHQKIDYQH